MIAVDSTTLQTAYDPKDRFGYYLVGADKFHNKPQALLRARDTGHHPTWHFHADRFAGMDWQSDRIGDLTTLYQARARQLREQYDYLVVSFSGGSDSWTVVNSFLSSGTHLDEVYVRWPIEAVVNRYPVSRDPAASNILSEWDLALLPQMRWFQEHMPHTRFTVVDWSNDFIRGTFRDDQWHFTNDMLNPGLFLKYNSIGPTEMQAIEQGLQTCMIYAVDKPQICVHEGNVYCYFLDKIANKHPNNNFQRNSELFYWTPDMPQVVWSQARAIYRYMLAHPRAASLVDWNQPYDCMRKQVWDELIRGVIYRDYTALGVFQAHKSGSNIWDSNDDWMFNHRDLPWMQSWQGELDALLESMDPRWLEIKNGRVDGFRGFIDGWYCLGPAPNTQ